MRNVVFYYQQLNEKLLRSSQELEKKEKEVRSEGTQRGLSNSDLDGHTTNMPSKLINHPDDDSDDESSPYKNRWSFTKYVDQTQV